MRLSFSMCCFVHFGQENCNAIIAYDFFFLLLAVTLSCALFLLLKKLKKKC